MPAQRGVSDPSAVADAQQAQAVVHVYGHRDFLLISRSRTGAPMTVVSNPAGML